MSFDAETLNRLSRLAALDISPDQLRSLGGEMDSILALIAQLQAVDTAGVTPLAHSLSVLGEVTLRLRPDVAVTDIDRAANMKNAPETENGLFLVPKVLE